LKEFRERIKQEWGRVGKGIRKWVWKILEQDLGKTWKRIEKRALEFFRIFRLRSASGAFRLLFPLYYYFRDARLSMVL